MSVRRPDNAVLSLNNVNLFIVWSSHFDLAENVSFTTGFDESGEAIQILPNGPFTVVQLQAGEIYIGRAPSIAVVPYTLYPGVGRRWTTVIDFTDIIIPIIIPVIIILFR